MTAGAETSIRVTFFDSYAANEKHEELVTLPALAARIQSTTAPAKDKLPWLKCARFGNERTSKGSLRHDRNLLGITGTELDYDGESVSFDDAVDTAQKAGLLSLIYTSPSASTERPRWRIVCPTSRELPPAKREHLIGRVNGLYRGIFAAESWTLSQSYYFGAVNNNPAHRVEIIDGQPIDELDELDEGWTGKPGTRPAGTGNGADTSPPWTSGQFDEVELLEEIRTGTNYHTAAMRLLGSWAQQGVSMVAAQKRLLDAFESVFPPDRDARWRARVDDIPRMLEYIWGKAAATRDAQEAELDAWDQQRPPPGARDKDRREPLASINPAELAGLPVPQRRWLVPDWIPLSRVTALYGPGGEGKTLLAQMLATAAAIGAIWLGLPVLRCKSLLQFCEDDLDEMHRRQDAINQFYGCSQADLGDMRWLPRLGDDNVLMSFVTVRGVHTPLFEQLLTEAKNFGAELVITDTLADVFSGNENDRGQARIFVQQTLALLARELKGAVLALAHPSRSGITSGTGESGSTGWDAAFRSRLYLETPKPEAGDPPDPYARLLTRKKANYALRDAVIEMRWQNGVFVTKTPIGGILGSIYRKSAERVFLDLLDRTTVEGQPVSSNSRSGNFAPRLFAMRPDRERYGKPDFERAMQGLFAGGTITNVQYGRKGDERYRITRV
jgi:RecA-family ATPase